VAGEGSFIVHSRREKFRDGSPRLRFIFQVAMASRDRQLLVGLRDFLGCGSIRRHQPRTARHSEMTIYAVTSLEEHLSTTIPFLERFLLASRKRAQYEEWRDRLLAYDRDRPSKTPRVRSRCSVAGCTGPVRGRMLCRSHYYRATGY